MEIKRFEFILRAVQPIAHHAKTFGNESILMRREIILPDGSLARVPEITGDTMRNGVRRSAALALLDAVGLLRESPRLSEAALRLLFSGGMVTGRGSSASINLDTYRTMCELMPILKHLGGCMDNRIVPGTTHVDGALLLCEQTAPDIELTSPWMLSWLQQNGRLLRTARFHVDEVQRTRMDPTLAPENRLLLSEEAQVAVNQRLLASEKAHAEDDALEALKAKSSMMPRRFEVVKQGSLFAWGIEARCYSALDVDAFMVAILSYLARASVGGKRGVGFGRLTPVACQQIEVMRPADRATSIVLETERAKVGRIFREHVAERKDRLIELLRTVTA